VVSRQYGARHGFQSRCIFAAESLVRLGPRRAAQFWEGRIFEIGTDCHQEIILNALDGFQVFCDHGLEEMGESTGEKGEPQLVIRCAFADFGKLQEALEARGIAPLSAEHEYICTVPTELPEEQATEVLTLIDKLEQDEDVQKVFHTLA